MTMIDNPFNITFGIEPAENISRTDNIIEIVDSFRSINGPHTFIITGQRGTGKTALLSSVKKEFVVDNSWIVIDVNPIENIQEQIAAMLYEKGKVKKLFLKKEFNFSFKGIGFSIAGSEPISDVTSLLEKMFDYLKSKSKKVLICIDEISSTKEVKSFVHTFQILYRNNYPIYFLATGLYEKVSLLENNETLTFLYRAPKIFLESLNLNQIARSYSAIFNVEKEVAYKYALLTAGYAFAYQLLGYLIWNNKGILDETVLRKYDEVLCDRSYEKIWTDLPLKEQKILEVLANSKENTNREVMQATGIPKNELSVYKSRLTKRGLINTSVRGYSQFVLPRFKEFILNYLEM